MSEARKIEPQDYRLIASMKDNTDASFREIADELGYSEEDVRHAVREGAKQRSFND